MNGEKRKLTRRDVREMKKIADKILNPHGLEAEIHPELLAVMLKGDARSYDPTIIVKPKETAWNPFCRVKEIFPEMQRELAVELGNKVPRCGRVLFEIKKSRLKKYRQLGLLV